VKIQKFFFTIIENNIYLRCNKT